MRFLFFSYFFSVSLVLSAQPQLPPEVEAKLPLLLSKSHPCEDALYEEFRSGINSKWGQKQTVDKFWIAYSDRADNTAYMSPNTNAQKSPKKLSFGEKVYIAKIENDMALVYTDTRPEACPMISCVAKSVGWVPMDNLMLWNTCPTDKRGVLNKAIIAIKLNNLVQDQLYQGRLYKNPDDHSQSQVLSMDMNFYYVMKMSKDDTQALLCLQPTFTGNNLYGWVKQSSYTPWKQRTCLEPNWSRAYVERHKGYKTYVYPDENTMDANGFLAYWEYGWTNGDEDPYMQYRMNPDMMRLPVLSPPNENGVVKCLCFLSPSTNIVGTFGYDPAFLKYKLGERGYNAWKAWKAISAYDGYARLSDSQGEPYWHYVVFLSAGEFDELTKRLQPVVEVARQRLKDRKHYVDAMKAVVRAQLKEEMTMSDKELKNMTPEQLDYYIYGIDIPTGNREGLTGHSIKEISNVKTFSNADYVELLDNVSEKYMRLLRIKNGDYRYKMTVNHVDYYWIPLEELP